MYLLNGIGPANRLFLKFSMENVWSFSAIDNKCPVTWKYNEYITYQRYLKRFSWVNWHKKGESSEVRRQTTNAAIKHKFEIGFPVNIWKLFVY